MSDPHSIHCTARIERNLNGTLDNGGLVGFVMRENGFKRWPQREDIEAAGQLGLVEAALTYEPQKGTKFSTWAVPRIKWEIQALLRKQDGMTATQRRCYKETGLVYTPKEKPIRKKRKVKSRWDASALRKGIMMNGGVRFTK